MKREGGRKGRKRERKIEMGRKEERKKRKRETTQIDNFLIWFIFTELNNSVYFPFSKLLIQQPFSIAGATWGGKVCVVWTEDCCSEFCTPKSSQTLLTFHLCPQLDFPVSHPPAPRQVQKDCPGPWQCQVAILSLTRFENINLWQMTSAYEISVCYFQITLIEKYIGVTRHWKQSVFDPF